MSSKKLLYCLDPNATPFTPNFLGDEPSIFVVPCNFETYNGATDPDDHLFVFTRSMRLYVVREVLWGVYFAITLRGKARMWFETLKPNSISNFNQLGQMFRTTFLHKVKLKQSTNGIMKLMPQLSQESLKDFFERVMDQVLITDQMGNQEFEELVINVFVNKLKPCPCLDDFKANPPFTLEDLKVRAHRFCSLEAGLIEQQQ